MSKTKSSKSSGKTSGADLQNTVFLLHSMFRRLCMMGLVLVCILFVYFAHEEISRKNPGDSQGSGQNGPGVFSYTVGKPAMDSDGNASAYQVTGETTASDAGISGTPSEGVTLDPDLLGTESSTSAASDSGSSPAGADLAAAGAGMAAGSTEPTSTDTMPTPPETDSPTGLSSELVDTVPSGEELGYSASSADDVATVASAASAASSLAATSGMMASSEDSGDSSFSAAAPPAVVPPAVVPPATSSDGEKMPSSAPLAKDYNSKTVTVGPDGKKRYGEVLILEEGRQKVGKNINGPAVSDFLELFDFNIKPDWVEANWSAIATVGPLTTRGYRVPVSTGPDESDLVGSLTYYFNTHLELEKITFEGYCGNTDRLVISLKYFHLNRVHTSDPNAILYVSETLADNRRSFMKSYYHLLPEDPNVPNKKFWITMELYPPED